MNRMRYRLALLLMCASVAILAAMVGAVIGARLSDDGGFTPIGSVEAASAEVSDGSTDALDKIAPIPSTIASTTSPSRSSTTSTGLGPAGDVRTYVLTGGLVLSEDLGRTLESVSLEDLGRARRVVVDKDSTTIIDGAGSSEAVASWGAIWRRSDLVRLSVTVRARNESQLIVRAAAQFHPRPVEEPQAYQRRGRRAEVGDLAARLTRPRRP